MILALFALALPVGAVGLIWLVSSVSSLQNRSIDQARDLAKVAKAEADLNARLLREEHPTAKQEREAIDRAIRGLTDRQRRELFRLLVGAASPELRQRLGLPPSAPEGAPAPQTGARPGSGSRPPPAGGRTPPSGSGGQGGSPPPPGGPPPKPPPPGGPIPPLPVPLPLVPSLPLPPLRLPVPVGLGAAAFRSCAEGERA